MTRRSRAIIKGIGSKQPLSCPGHGWLFGVLLEVGADSSPDVVFAAVMKWSLSSVNASLIISFNCRRPNDARFIVL